MNDQIEDGLATSSRSRRWRWVFWLGAVLVLYVLSTGPVAMMLDKKFILEGSPTYRVLHIFYTPVEWAYQKTPLHRPLGIYWYLWAPGLFNSDGNWKF